MLSQLNLLNGGTLIAPVLATYNGGTITVTNMSSTLSALTNIDSTSLVANGGGILTLPNVASYAEAPFGTTNFQATGTGSKLDLTGITSLAGTSGLLNVTAQSGGTIEMDSLPSTTARAVRFTVDGATSTVDLSALTSGTDTILLSQLNLLNGGTLIAPLLATYSGGTITVTNMSATLSQLTNINSSSLTANGGGILSLPNVTSYAEAPFGTTTFQANGAGSKIDVTPITSVTGTTGSFNINANAGGTIEIDSLVSTTVRDTNLNADGPASLVNASALVTWTDSTNSGNVTVTNSGTVTLSPATATLTGVTVSASSSGLVDAGSIILATSSPLVGNGGTVDADVTSNQLTSPGPVAGRVTVTGAYVQGPAANFAIEIIGLTVATQYDQLKVNGTVALSGNLILSGSYVANVGDTFTIIDNDGADAVTGTFNNSPEGDVYTFNGRPLRLSYQGGDGNDVTLTRIDNLVVNRRIFYNESAFDGNNAAINTNDDLAIAPDKTPLLPGAGPATIANITNFTRGINGIMVDVSGTGTHTSININDFVFKVGANNSPSLWTGATAPTAISVRPGAGYRGADRVEITWASNVIQDQYLEVQFLPTGNSGLGSSDVFFWGNLVGETATTTPAGSFARSAAADGGAILANGTQFNVGITNTLDINKSNSITAAADRGPIIAAGTKFLTRISIASGGPFAPEGGDGDAGIASALASTTMPTAEAPRILPQNSQNVARLDDAVSLSVTNNTDDLLTDDHAETLQVADDADEFFAVDVDEDLLDVLAGAL